MLQAGSGLEVLGLDVFVVFTNGFLNELFTNLLHNMCDFLANGPLSLKKVIARYLMCQLPMMADGPPCYASPLIGMVKLSSSHHTASTHYHMYLEVWFSCYHLSRRCHLRRHGSSHRVHRCVVVLARFENHIKHRGNHCSFINENLCCVFFPAINPLTRTLAHSPLSFNEIIAGEDITRFDRSIDRSAMQRGQWKQMSKQSLILLAIAMSTHDPSFSR